MLTLAVIVFGLWLAFGLSAVDVENVGRHTALVEVDGTIEADGKASAESIISALDKAYSNSGSVGVVMRINSPGGSPVQAGMVNDEMRRLRAAYPDKPLYVVVDEMCASGGYYIAAAADKIYVNKASIVGSIGVLMDGFGFTGLMEKLGVERRLLTAGQNKGLHGSVQPAKPGAKGLRAADAGGNSSTVHRCRAQRAGRAFEGNAGHVLGLVLDRQQGG